MAATLREIQARLRAATKDVVAVDVVTGTTTALKAASTGNRHYVVGYSLLINGNQRVDFKSNTTLLKSVDAESAAFAEDRVEGRDGRGDDWLLRTAAGEALNLVTDAAIRVTGTVEVKTISDS